MSSRKKSRRGKAAAKRTSRYLTLTARQKAARERSLALLPDLRAGKAPYSKLLRQHRVSTRTAHKYLGRNLGGGTRRGEPVRPSKSDRLLRELLFPHLWGTSRCVPAVPEMRQSSPRFF